MRTRVAILLLGFCLAAAAQEMTVRALVQMVRSSLELGHKDKEIAKYLKRVKLTERLSPSVIEDLQGLGAGPRTLEALRMLQAASAGLPEPGKIEPKRRKTLPPPPPEEQKRIIEGVRQYALNYVRQLPDFICVQVTRRYVDPSGLEFWHKLDTVTAKLTYFEQKEDYKVILINNRPVDLTMDQIGGSTSTGEFGTMMKEIFDPETETEFRWLRWGKLRGRICHVYSYFVRQDKSKWVISYERKLRTVPAYRGLIYVDRDTELVTRIVLEAVNIPPSFPVQQARTVLDYDFVEISGRPYMLPLKFEMRMRQGRMLVKNEVEFRMYRKFGAEAVIKFETPDELPDEMFSEEPPSQEQQPPQQQQ